MAIPTYRQTYESGTAVVTSVIVSAGDLIIVNFTDDAVNEVTITCADDASGGSNVYTPQGGILNNTTAATPFNSISFWAIAKASATLTITVTSDLSYSPSVYVCVYYNTSSTPYEQVLSKIETSMSTSHTSPSVTTTNPNDIVVNIYQQYDAASIGFSENGTGFTPVTNVDGNGFTYKVVTSPTTLNEAVTTATAVQYTITTLVFKAPVSYQPYWMMAS